MRFPSTPCANQTFAHRARAAFAQTTIVFGCAAFISETRDDDLARVSIHELRDLLNFSALGSTNALAIEIEIDRLKLIAVDVAAEKRGAFASLRQRRAGDGITGRARAVAATFLAATGEENEQSVRTEKRCDEETRESHKMLREISGCDLERKRAFAQRSSNIQMSRRARAFVFETWSLEFFGDWGFGVAI